MAIIVFPAGLPNPSLISMQPNERRLVSTVAEGLPKVRRMQRDFTGFEDVRWNLTVDLDLVFFSWWRDTLINGGRWFTASWPQLNGKAVLVRFILPPSRRYAGNDYWEITAKLEIRGIYGTTAYDVEPGGSRVNDAYWVLFSRPAAVYGDNSVPPYQGDSISNAAAYYGPLNEQITALVYYLTQHPLGTFPSGPVVVWTAVATKINPGDPGVTPTVIASTAYPSTATVSRASPAPAAGAVTFPLTNFRFLAIDLSSYSVIFFQIPMKIVVTATIDGVAAGFTGTVFTTPQGILASGRYPEIAVNATTVYG